MKQCRFFLFILIMLFIGKSILLAEETIKQEAGNNSHILRCLTVDPYGISFSIIKENHIISLRSASKFENPIVLLGWNVSESNIDLGILYGKALRFKRGTDGFISFAGGVSLVRDVSRGELISEDKYEKVIRYTIGFPLELQFVKKMVGPFGIGIYGFANINSIRTTYGGFLSCHIANFRKSEGTIPFKNKEHFLEFDLLRFFHLTSFNNFDNLAINGCVAFQDIIKNWEIALPFYYRYSKDYLIHNDLKQFFSLDFQLRKFPSANKEGLYFDFGIQYLNITGLYGDDPDDKTSDYLAISAGLGHRHFFTQNLYHSSELKITRPLLGHMKYLEHAYAEEGINGKNFIFRFEILNIGITF